MKKILKLTIPLAPLNLSLESFIDPTLKSLDTWEIHINNPEIQEADCWFILENVPEYDRKCRVARENVIFLAAETAQSLGYIEETSSIKLFMSQFGKAFTYHQYVSPNSISSPPFLPWMINSNHGESIWNPHKRDVSFFTNLNPPEKHKLISVICSTQNLTEAHRMRFRFVEKLKQHFGDSIDWYGNGIASVEQKWDALADYKYTVVLENQSRHNVITEKIGDAFLAHTYPFYWGAPNIGDVFDLKGLSQIHIEDFTGTIKRIELGIETDLFTRSAEALTFNRNITVSDFNFLNRMFVIADSLTDADKSFVELYSQEDLRIHEKLSSGIQRLIVKTTVHTDRWLGTNFLEITKQFYILFRYNKFSRFVKKYFKKLSGGES